MLIFLIDKGMKTVEYTAPRQEIGASGPQFSGRAAAEYKAEAGFVIVIDALDCVEKFRDSLNFVDEYGEGRVFFGQALADSDEFLRVSKKPRSLCRLRKVEHKSIWRQYLLYQRRFSRLPGAKHDMDKRFDNETSESVLIPSSIGLHRAQYTAYHAKMKG